MDRDADSETSAPYPNFIRRSCVPCRVAATELMAFSFNRKAENGRLYVRYKARFAGNGDGRCLLKAAQFNGRFQHQSSYH